jgi:hypothetical protein
MLTRCTSALPHGLLSENLAWVLPETLTACRNTGQLHENVGASGNPYNTQDHMSVARDRTPVKNTFGSASLSQLFGDAHFWRQGCNGVVRTKRLLAKGRCLFGRCAEFGVSADTALRDNKLYCSMLAQFSPPHVLITRVGFGMEALCLCNYYILFRTVSLEDLRTSVEYEVESGSSSECTMHPTNLCSKAT